MSIERDVRLAARALSRHGLAHAYGHVSARVDGESFVVTPAHPLGRVKPDTALVRCPIQGDLAPGALPEVRIHQAIYRRRAEVGGICRFQSPHVITLSALRKTSRVLHGLGAYFAPEPPLWEDPMLVRDPERAAAVAEKLGDARAIVLAGNGAVTVGTEVRQATALAFFLEDAARVDLAVRASGEASVLYTTEQAARRGAADASLYDRMWEYMIGDDADLTEVHA